MSLVPREHRAAYGVLFASFVLFGTSLTVIGAVLPRMLADFGWSYLSAGFVIASGAAGFFVSAYGAGRIADRAGFRTCISIGLLLNVAGLLAFAWTPSAILNAFIYFVVGVGQGFLEVAVNWSIVKMAPGASGRPMSLMHGAFSIGAVSGPIMAGAIITNGLPWGFTYRVLGLVFLALLIVVAATPTQGLSGSFEDRAAHRDGLTRQPAYWLGFTVLMLYVGVELGLSNWMGEFFVTVLRAEASTGAFAVSVFWGGILAGRFGVPWLYRGPRQDRVLLISAGVIALAAALLASTGFSGMRVLAFGASAMAGLGCACVYPIAVSLVGESFPQARGEAMGFASAGGGLGALLFPMGTGFIAKTWGLRVAYVTYIALALAVLGTCALLVLFVRRRLSRPFVDESAPMSPFPVDP
jgi:fucose permease